MDSEPPSDLPADLADRLGALSEDQLRTVIDYCQEQLTDTHAGALDVEARPGEEIVSVTEHEGYTAVVKRIPCAAGCDDCPHGPYLFHVTREPGPDGESSQKWRYLGPVYTGG